MGLTREPKPLTPGIKVGKSEIRGLIPHSGDMCLLDGVLEWDDDSILCVTETHRDLTNPLRRADQLGAVHAFEYGAQAAAVHGGIRARAQGDVAPPGYLAALREGVLYVDRLDNISLPLHVHGRRLFGSGVDTVYECRVSAGGTLLATGRVTIMLRTS